MLNNLTWPALLAGLLVAPAVAQVVVPEQRQATDIRLRYASFDPLVAPPKVPVLLRSTNEQGLWIVQFHATPTQADRNAMQQLGGQLIGYLPDNAYVVRMTAGLAVMTALGTVQFQNLVADVPAFSMDPDVQQQIVDSATDAAVEVFTRFYLYAAGLAALALIPAWLMTRSSKSQTSS